MEPGDQSTARDGEAAGNLMKEVVLVEDVADVDNSREQELFSDHLRITLPCPEIDDTVRLCNIVSKTELNGQLATVIGIGNRGVQVQLSDGGGGDINQKEWVNVGSCRLFPNSVQYKSVHKIVRILDGPGMQDQVKKIALDDRRKEREAQEEKTVAFNKANKRYKLLQGNNIWGHGYADSRDTWNEKPLPLGWKMIVIELDKNSRKNAVNLRDFNNEKICLRERQTEQRFPMNLQHVCRIPANKRQQNTADLSGNDDGARMQKRRTRSKAKKNAHGYTPTVMNRKAKLLKYNNQILVYKGARYRAYGPHDVVGDKGWHCLHAILHQTYKNDESAALVVLSRVEYKNKEYFVGGIFVNVKKNKELNILLFPAQSVDCSYREITIMKKMTTIRRMSQHSIPWANSHEGRKMQNVVKKHEEFLRTGVLHLPDDPCDPESSDETVDEREEVFRNENSEYENDEAENSNREYGNHENIEHENSEICSLCAGGKGNLFLCDSCPNSYHRDCLDDIGKKSLLKDPWCCADASLACSQCISGAEVEKEIKSLAKKLKKKKKFTPDTKRTTSNATTKGTKRITSKAATKGTKRNSEKAGLASRITRSSVSKGKTKSPSTTEYEDKYQINIASDDSGVAEIIPAVETGKLDDPPGYSPHVPPAPRLFGMEEVQAMIKAQVAAALKTQAADMKKILSQKSSRRDGRMRSLSRSSSPQVRRRSRDPSPRRFRSSRERSRSRSWSRPKSVRTDARTKSRCSQSCKKARCAVRGCGFCKKCHWAEVSTHDFESFRMMADKHRHATNMALEMKDIDNESLRREIENLKKREVHKRYGGHYQA